MSPRRKSRPDKLAFAKAMRKKPTRAERLVWEELQYWRYAKVRFLRQAVLCGYIADFYCPKARLIVEIDGPIHDPWKDHIRDFHLAKAGLKVIRFTNAQVFTNLAQVLVEIREAYRARSKYLRRKAVKAKSRKSKTPVSTIPQAQQQQQEATVLKSDVCDERCGYVEIVDKYSETVKLVILPLFESSLCRSGNHARTFLHEHRCANCEGKFGCILADCNGGPLDPDLCADCERTIGQFWRR